MIKILSPKYLKNQNSVIFFASMIFLFSEIAWGQPTSDSEEIEESKSEGFVNLGYISVSPKYIISTNGKTITYKIRNNTTRSISHLFAWIYEVKKQGENTTPSYRLVNNPNRAGLPVKGIAHPPGKIADWRFPLTAAETQKKSGVSYTFRISHRGVFFTNLEKTKPPQ